MSLHVLTPALVVDPMVPRIMAAAVVGILCAFACLGLLTRNLRSPLARGLELALAGRPVEAEQCYRQALAGARLGEGERRSLLVSLGDALIDQGRYAEAGEQLDRALEMGDPTGSCRASQATLRLLQGIEPQQALDLVMQAIAASEQTIGGWSKRGGVQGELAVSMRAGLQAQKAWALAVCGRTGEAEEAMRTAASQADEAYAALSGYNGRLAQRIRLTVQRSRANTYWRIGMAWLALKQPEQARRQFEVAIQTDPAGKYGALCQKQLAQLEAAVR